ncbi:hypothetical protein B0H14DRAFT_2588240 [Mycena olivaceomarginata]|nr:hypothetical protein B0H14DRAFT_2588240 [Mycena olivaceomarginata]
MESSQKDEENSSELTTKDQENWGARNNDQKFITWESSLEPSFEWDRAYSDTPHISVSSAYEDPREVQGGSGERSRERALDGRKSWGMPGDVTVVTPGNAAEASGRALDGRLTCALTENLTSEICAPHLRAILRRQNFSRPLTILAEGQIGTRTQRKR